MQAWNDDTNYMILYSENLGCNIEFYISPKGNVTCTYVATKYKNECEEKIGVIAENIYGECVVICRPSTWSGNPQATFEEYVKNPVDFRTAILVNSDSSTYEADGAKLCKELTAADIWSQMIRIYYYPTETPVISVQIDDIDSFSFIPDTDYWGHMIINADGDITYSRWEVE